MPPSRYFVTGATGLVGSLIVRHLLAEGHAVSALRRPGRAVTLLGPVAGQVTWAEGSLHDFHFLTEQFAQADYVIHAAAKVSFWAREASEMYHTNVEGTANVVNACLAAGVKKLCHISSVAALGKPNPQGLIDEKSPWDAEASPSRYAASKHFAEREVWRGVAEGLPAVVLCPSVVLGEGQWDRSTGQLFNYVRQGGRFYVPGLINLVDGQDVARVVPLLCQGATQGERYILSAADLTYQDFFAQVAQAVGQPAPAWRLHPGAGGWLARLAGLWAWLTGGPPRLTTDALRASLTQNRYRADKIKTAVPGFEYQPVAAAIARMGAHLMGT
ncbi:MAG: NAD-dependent epimerase/dehydratase family protein [Bernardetiaceae bacterium]|nr:NAD-dependent epimerase/dehydratase family protein [Bernardetiaceae bacterium]